MLWRACWPASSGIGSPHCSPPGTLPPPRRSGGRTARIAAAVFCGRRSHSVMLWAAALTATYGLFRPSELFGSAQNTDRALRPDAVTFFSHPRSRAVAGVPHTPPLTAWPCPIVSPFGWEIQTKADPRAKNPDHPVAAHAPAAVRALWRWMRLRSQLGPGAADRVFQIPGSPPLTLRALTRALSTALSTQLGQPTRVLGRSFGHDPAGGRGRARRHRGHGPMEGRQHDPRLRQRGVAELTRGGGLPGDGPEIRVSPMLSASSSLQSARCALGTCSVERQAAVFPYILVFQTKSGPPFDSQL